MNLIRENSRLGIEEPISIRAPSNKRRRERKQHQQTTQDIKKQNARQPATSRQKPHMWAGAVKEPGQTGEDRIHWTIIMTTLFFLALSRLVFLFVKLLWFSLFIFKFNPLPPRLQYLIVSSLFKSAPKLKYCFLVRLCLFIWNTVVLITRLYMYTVPEIKKIQRIRRIKCLGPISTHTDKW